MEILQVKSRNKSAEFYSECTYTEYVQVWTNDLIIDRVIKEDKVRAKDII